MTAETARNQNGSGPFFFARAEALAEAQERLEGQSEQQCDARHAGK